MKLIIDIPEEAYNVLLTEQVLPHIDVEWLLMHGIPLDDVKAEIGKKGETYGDIINFYLTGLVETYKRMGYTITEISITRKENSLNPIIYEFGEKEGE